MCVAVVLFATGSVSADIIHLVNGNRIEGRVEIVSGGDYRVTIDLGNVVTIAAADVLRREAKEAPLDELERRSRKVDDDDRDGLVELAAWADLKGLRKAALSIYRRILRVDPHHEGARQQLGYVLHRNRWVKRAELKDQGLVRFRGHWRTPAEVERIRAEETSAAFLTLLEDVHHDNKFIRENARIRLVQTKDPRLVPTLVSKLAADDPLDRLLCGQVLANHGFGVAGEPLYRALLLEKRTKVATGFSALLGGLGVGRVGTWVARDLSALARRPGALDETTERRLTRLVDFSTQFPHRDAVDPLLDLMEARPYWRARIDRILSRYLGVESRSASQWQAYWNEVRARVPADLGAGWIKDRGKKGRG